MGGMHEQDLAIVKGLVSVAWADGHVTSEESDVIKAGIPSPIKETNTAVVLGFVLY